MDHSTVSILDFELEGREGKRNERRAPDAVVSLDGPKGAVPGEGPPPERK